MTRSFYAGLLGTVAAVFCTPALAADAPDIVLLNGKVLTVDSKDSVVEAIAVTGNKITAVGTAAEIAKLAGAKTKKIELNGRTVTPGLIDTHAHLTSGGVSDVFNINLAPPNATSMADVQRLVKEKVAKSKPGEFIRGNGWDESKLAELRYITAKDIDAVSPNNPVYLTQTMGHYGTANTAAMKLAGITKDTPDPPGGTIDRGPDGTPTGVFKERAQSLIRSLIPPTTDEQQYEGIAVTAQGMANECITAIKDPGIGQQAWDSYKKVQADGKLPIRIFTLWRTPNNLADAEKLVARIAKTTRPYETTGDDQVISGGIKIGLDGSGGARTAWMHDDWSKDWTGTDTGNKGYPVFELQLASDLVKLYHNAGLHIGTHAIGDHAIDWIVDKYEELQKASPNRNLRHTIIHANVPTEHALDTMASLQKNYETGYPEAQGPFLWWLGDTYAGNLGPDRAPRLKPFKAYLDRGIIWGNGSDYPVAPYPARFGLWASVDRSTLLGIYGQRPFGTENSVDIHVALRSYTDWAARTLFLEKKIGTIEVGKYADLAVWDKDIYNSPIDEIKDMKCSMTIANGKIVHGG